MKDTNIDVSDLDTMTLPVSEDSWNALAAWAKERETLIDTITTHFQQRDFAEVKLSVWKGVRLYVNISNEPAFSYALNNNFKIASNQLLSGRLYTAAKELVTTLQACDNDTILSIMDGERTNIV